MLGTLAALAVGCVHTDPRTGHIDPRRLVHHTPTPTHDHPPILHHPGPLAAPIDQVMIATELEGPQPVEVYIQRAMAENRNVQAARLDVLAMRHRIPQVTALEDPVVLQNIWPIPSNAPQFALMGYGPYELMLAQEFPWFGVLRLRGQAAEQEVKMALFDLAEAQLEVVARVKQAYYDLYFAEQAEFILLENRELATDIRDLAYSRLEAGLTSQQDALRAEVAIDEISTELAEVRAGIANARARLARELHISPEAELQTLSTLTLASVPDRIENLYRLATVARPELQGQLAAIRRDEREIELARKRYYPNVTLGIGYMMMTRENAMSPEADGMDNIGLVVGFNLPIYRKKLAAGLAEAQARAAADARRYEYLRDETFEQIKQLLAEAEAQREVLELLRDSILPRSDQALQIATTDYSTGAQDFVTLITAWRELLQIQIQSVRVESALGKTLAELERVVGVQLNAHPPDPSALQTLPPAEAPSEPPPPADDPGPFEALE